MWIIPKNLPVSSGVRDTLGFTSDLNELSQICAPSLMLRSKHSRSQTWLQKWKRDSWMSHLSGRISKPSLANNFTDWWTSSLQAILASRSVEQGYEEEKTIPDTFSPTSDGQLTLFAPDSSFLKTWKDTYPSVSEKSLPTWLALDTEWELSVESQRGEYSQRQKSAHPIAGSACSFLPSDETSDWRTPTTEQLGTGDHMESMTTKDGDPAQIGQRMYNKNGKLAIMDLNRQIEVLSWATPNTMDFLPSRSFDAMKKQATVGGRKNRSRPGNLREQLDPVMCQAYQEAQQEANWPTAANRDYRTPNSKPYSERGGENKGEQLPNFLAHHISSPTSGQPRQGHCSFVGNLPESYERNQETENWSTPRVKGQEKGTTRLARGKDLGLQGQVEKNLEKAPETWMSPCASDGEGGVMEFRDASTGHLKLRDYVQAGWATPNTCDSTRGSSESTEQKKARNAHTGQSLIDQVKPSFATPKESDAKSPGKSRDAHLGHQTGGPSASLNPRWVEALMGLPIGWLMPSCATPVTIESTNLGCQGMGLCLTQHSGQSQPSGSEPVDDQPTLFDEEE